MVDVPGTMIGGRFRLERHLAQGGMGSVWLAVQEPLGRSVAVKVIRAEKPDADAQERFRVEATLVAQLRCPHVVTVFDFGVDDGAPYLAMELLQGETLRDRLKRGTVAVDEALGIARDVACGLRSAHEMGIVHRDLKPENVALVPDADRGCRAKLLDFGIARLSAKHTDATVTSAGVVSGTPGYIAPEVVLSGSSDDPRVDVYAFGVILFEMLCGVAPYSAQTPLALIMAHASAPLPDPRAFAALSPALTSLVQRLLAKSPGDRPADGAALVREIDGLRSAVMHASEPTMSAEIAPLPERPSIAVQPFTARGGGDDELLAEGISEDILIALSSFKQLFVVAQGSMWQAGGRDSDVLRVGRLLGVRFVLSGTVRRMGGTLRISVALVDTISGVQVWGQRFDRPAEDVFAVQDEVTQAIVACVAGRVERAHADMAKRKAPHALEAYDWLARSRAFHHMRTREDNVRAREAADRAISLDPEYAQAYAWRACALAQSMTVLGGPPVVEETEAAIGRAIALDDADAECHRLACEMSIVVDLQKAFQHHTRAIELNPNDARIVAQRGELATYFGRIDEAVAALELAMRLDPLGQAPYRRLLAQALFIGGDVDKSWALLTALDETRPDVRALVAIVAAARGDVARAQAQREKIPGGLVWFLNRLPLQNHGHLDRWRNALKEAGL